MSRSDFYVRKKCKAIVVECLNLCTGLIKRSEVVVGCGGSHVDVTVTAEKMISTGRESRPESVSRLVYRMLGI